MIEKSHKAKVVCTFSCESAKKIWHCLEMDHEGTKKVKESKEDMLTTQYENFTMKKGEIIPDMSTRFSLIIN